MRLSFFFMTDLLSDEVPMVDISSSEIKTHDIMPALV
jgi:hypothetical protein